jgi:mRNA-degrading endonuclease RelE of RelBE toxin-antitoxin system
MTHYNPSYSQYFENDYAKVVRKNRGFQKQIDNKLMQILENPDVFKPLKRPLQGYRRAHIGSYIVTFRIKEEEVLFTRLAHHHEIYGIFHE